MLKLNVKIILLTLAALLICNKTIYAALDRTITVQKNGKGSGLVTGMSDSGSLSCGISCSGFFSQTSTGDDPSVTLTAQADYGSVFVAWGGSASSCGSNSTCVIKASVGTQTVIANFDLKEDRIISVQKTGKGQGTINGDSATYGSIYCGSYCSSTFSETSGGQDPDVTLTAKADSGSVFTGWDGAAKACGTSSTCVIKASAGTKTVIANFDLKEDHIISIQKTGKGEGTVVGNSTASGFLYCGTSCISTYSQTTEGQDPDVTLTVSAYSGSVFTGWDGAAKACGTNTTCIIKASVGTKTVIANFDLKEDHIISVQKTGSGAGTVIGDSASYGYIYCGTNCSSKYSQTSGGQDPDVTLTAKADSGSIFTGWDGAAKTCGTSTTCVIKASPGTKTVIANFDIVPVNSRVISVNKTGSGSGKVSATTNAKTGTIDCGSICGGIFPEKTESGDKTSVVLTAIAEPGSIFAGWSGGGCDGAVSNACVLEASKDQQISAKFILSDDHVISVAKIGSGSGQVTASSDTKGGFNCGINCSANFNPTAGGKDTLVTLIATPDTGSVFDGWSETSCGKNLTCLVTATVGVKNITASFKGASGGSFINLTVINEGSGSDYGSIKTVLPSPPPKDGIQCIGVKYDGIGNSNCTEDFVAGTGVTLNAAVNKNAGALFSGWEVYFLQTGDYIKQPNMCRYLDTTCNLTVPFNVPDIRIKAKFDLGYILRLQVQGEGSGSISNEAGTLCSGTFSDDGCTQTYGASQIITLTALPSANSTLIGWTIDGEKTNICPDRTVTCTVPMNKAHLVTARFDKVLSGTYVATILKEGSGTGFGNVTGTIVSSKTKKIDCGTECSAVINQSDSVRFEATPNQEGVSFAGWLVRFKRYTPDGFVWDDYTNTVARMCTGLQPVCEVTVTADTQVMARFDYDITLTVVRDGGGSGSIVSSSQVLNKCTVESAKTICAQTFVNNQLVTLNAVAELKSRFVKWNGCLTTQDNNQDGTQETCNITMDKAKLITATFEAIDSAKLSVTKDPNGTGVGTIKADLLGLECGTICNRNYPFNTDVVLTAIPDEGSEFVGWGGDWCSGLQPTCKLNMSQAKDVTARFDKGFKLTLNRQGEGDGFVYSEPSGISCGTSCAYSFTNNVTVVLTAKAASGSTFLGWGGACTGTQLTCTVKMNEARTVAVTFSGVGLGKALDNANLTWTTTGDTPWFGQQQKSYSGGSAALSGLISHNQQSALHTVMTGPVTVGFSWKVSSEKNSDILSFAVDGVVLTKISGNEDWTQVSQKLPAGQHTLTWIYAKDADLSEGEDRAWLDQVKIIPLIPDVVPPTLTISTQGTGSGTVSSNPSGISCGSACSAVFSDNTAITLTANAIGGATFAGWSGACKGTNPTCLVTLQGSQTVVATFNRTGNPAVNSTGVLNLGLLNDTGIDWCANKTSHFLVNKEASCTALSATFPGQDGLIGRDALARQGKLFKMGTGDAGFDFTKVCNNGQAAGEGTCPSNPQLGDKATQWACTRDNVTGLLWEVKTTGGMRDKETGYSWYNSNPRTNGGNKGDNCTAALCNTDSYVQAINQQGLCGANDWRLPTRQELHSIVHHGRSNPAIDIAFFPNTSADLYWTATPVAASPFNARIINFDTGWDFWDSKTQKHLVRLVRTCTNCDLATTQIMPVYNDSRLSLPLVKVGYAAYAAQLRLISANSMVFELTDAQLKKLPNGPSVNNAPYFRNGQLVINDIAVGGARYKAILQLVAGSNPLRFKLQTAQVLR